MKRNLLVGLSVALILTSLGWVAHGQEEVELLNGYIRSELHLISQESKATWSEKWTGPIQAATNLAWLSENGYPEFLRDFNGDGVIDELDTIELANILGTNLMRTETPLGTNDARLVIGLARYVADLYPGEFVIKIYDPGFPSEFATESGMTFASDAIPGIELRLEGDPTIEAYQMELESSEGVIVGLEVGEERNTYLSGRSFMYEETRDGYVPVDLTWAEENRFEPGTQGRILETLAMMDDEMFIEYRVGWTRVDFMLALSPAREHDFTSMRYDCPSDAIAYHVTTNPTAFGTVEVEECVLREGDVDLYYWIVHNIDFVYDSCGVCTFVIANYGQHAVGNYGPMMWPFMETPGAWVWRAPMGSCGFMPGQTAVFMVAVPGPTVDAWTSGAVLGCVWGPSLVMPGGYIRTTGPLEGVTGECPDIVLVVDDHGCTTLPDGGLRFTVWPLSVDNIGGADTTHDFSVTAFAPGYTGSASVTVSAPFVAGGHEDLPPLVFVIPPAEAPDPACPITIRVVADSSFAVDECDEGNNTAEFEECCPEGPDGERGACCDPATGLCFMSTADDCLAEGFIFAGPGTDCSMIECPPETGQCPDLVVAISLVTCSCDEVAAGQMASWHGRCKVTVTNIGGAPSPAITDGLLFQPGGDEENVPALNPGEDVSFWFSFNGSGRTCEGLTISLSAVVDPDNDVDECGQEGNNTAVHEEDCS